MASSDYGAQIQQLTESINDKKAQIAKYTDYTSQLVLYNDTMAKVAQQKKEDEVAWKR